MKFSVFTWLGLTCAFSPVFAADSPSSSPFATGLSAWARGQRAEFGFYATDLKTGEALVDVGGNQPLSAASSIKILTAAAALETLKPWGKFPLKVERISNGLKLTGSGDPTFVTEDLFMLAREIARKIPQGFQIDTVGRNPF
jgi:D-alanyl-D-alanine carboxypeptidase